MIDVFAMSSNQVLRLDDEETQPVLTALSSESARQILSVLNDQPATVSELADHTGLTPQNVSYHLNKLTDAELVIENGSRGSGANEATVYTAEKNVVLSTDDGVGQRTPFLGVLCLTIVALLIVACFHSFTNLPVELASMVIGELNLPEILF